MRQNHDQSSTLSTRMREEQYDAIIVGAGFSGVHQLILFRQFGLRCIVIEAGSDFGGVWHWNTYPGARVDNHIPLYELAFPELWRDWTWTEKFPSQKELQAYFVYVADKMDLRPHCRFDTVVKQAHWDDQSHLWHVTAEGREGLYRTSARYLILCVGFASKPYVPDIKGRETFKGTCCHTSQWPKDGIEMAGKRVGVIGTGASGVQVIQEIGPQSACLTVFQRTPNLALPMGQYSMNKKIQDHFKPVYEEMFKKLETTFSGSFSETIPRIMMSDSEEEREVNFEKIWNLMGFSFLSDNYRDLLFDKASNNAAYAFWKKKVSERIKDPEKRVLLAPEVPPHPVAAKRHSLEQTYYETFNRDNVDLVNINATPILEINEKGLRTTNKEYNFDVLVFATGFDAWVGGFAQIDLRGLNGETIQDHWKNGVTTYLGMTIDNFPNLFFEYGPQGPAPLSNGVVCLQIQGRWVSQTIAYLRKYQITKFTPTTLAALTYKKHITDICNATLISEANGWYNGANIPGKIRETYSYFGGLEQYAQEIKQEADCGYPGFMREMLR